MALYKDTYARDAVMINGQFLEDLIPGHFYTLTSSGRETLTKEINSSSYKRNGTIKNYTRFPEKNITITFILTGDDEEEFRQNMNQLVSLLNVEDADIQFNDEVDKFYTGTLSINNLNKKYGTWAEGTYKIVCQDPFKYSTTVYESSPVVSGHEATFTINYGGNQPSRPVLKASFGTEINSGEYTSDDDCGFIAFFDSEGHIIQLGNPDAENLDSSAKAANIYSANIDNISASDFTNKWNNIGTGSVVKRNMNDINFNRGVGWNHNLISPSYASSFGSENGPKMVLSASNNFQNYSCNYVARLYSMNTTTDRGILRLYARSTDDKKFGVTIMKTDSSATAVVGYWVDDVIVKSERIDISQYNEHFGWTKKTPVYKYVQNKAYPVMVPEGSNIQRLVVYKQELNGYTYSQVNGNIVFSKRGNSFYFKVGNLPSFTYTYSRSDGTTLTFDELDIDFRRLNNYTYWEAGLQSIICCSLPGAHFTDQKNVFQAGDIIEADCKSANIQKYGLNCIEGKNADEYGALGNDWEEFVLYPGTNNIKAVWSDWATTAPNLKILYNEVFL